MSNHVVTGQYVDKVGSLYKEKSDAEIAAELHICVFTVKKIRNANGFIRTAEEKKRIRSKTRTNLIRAERRRALFGLDQKTSIKVFTNRERNILKNCLKRKKYVFLKRGDVVAYWDENTIRDISYEERGRKLGLKFKNRTQCEA